MIYLVKVPNEDYCDYETEMIRCVYNYIQAKYGNILPVLDEKLTPQVLRDNVPDIYPLYITFGKTQFFLQGNLDITNTKVSVVNRSFAEACNDETLILNGVKYLFPYGGNKEPSMYKVDGANIISSEIADNGEYNLGINMKCHYISRMARGCLDYYGQDTETVVAMEECGELIQAYSRCLRAKENAKTNLKEEMADVLLTMDFMMVNFGLKDYEIIGWMAQKLCRKWRNLKKMLIEKGVKM